MKNICEIIAEETACFSYYPSHQLVLFSMWILFKAERGILLQ